MAKQKDIQSRIIQAKVSDLKENPDNPRTITGDALEKLKASIREFPAMLQLRPIVVDADMVVLGGNMRLRACKELGITDVPIIRADSLTEKEKERFIIADNVAFGEWDFEALANDWDVDELDAWGVDIDLIFSGDQDNRLNSEAKEDDYELPVEIKTDIEIGDVFEIGEHRLVCGDSTIFETFEKLMIGRVANIVITDPDFSMDIEGVKSCYENTKKILDGVSFWICADKQAVQLAANDFDNFAKFFVQDFRQATLVANNQPMTRHVMICQFGRRAMNNLHDGFSTLLQIATDRTSEAHKMTPMSKKVELPAQFISHYSEVGDIVVDCFAHSGSTIVAAEQLGRVCYAVELDPKYCQCIIERMQKNFPELKMTRNGQIFKNSFHN